jgi:hypothetical protein
MERGGWSREAIGISMLPRSMRGFNWSPVARFFGALFLVLALTCLVAIAFSRVGVVLDVWGTKPLLELTAMGIVVGLVSRLAALNWAGSLILFVCSGIGCMMLVFYISSESPFRELSYYEAFVALFEWGLVLGVPIHLVLGSIIRALNPNFPNRS